MLRLSKTTQASSVGLAQHQHSYLVQVCFRGEAINVLFLY